MSPLECLAGVAGVSLSIFFSISPTEATGGKMEEPDVEWCAPRGSWDLSSFFMFSVPNALPYLAIGLTRIDRSGEKGGGAAGPSSLRSSDPSITCALIDRGGGT